MHLLDTLTYTSILFCAYYFIRLTTRPLQEKIKLNFSIYYGLFYGMMAILTQLAPFKLHDGVIVDARNIFIALSTFLGGPISGVITLIFSISNRLVLGGLGVTAGIVIMLVAFFYGLTLRQLYQKKLKRQPRFYEIWLISLVLSFLGISIAYLILPKEIALEMIKRYLTNLVVIDFIWTFIFWEFELSEINRIKEQEYTIRNEHLLQVTQDLAKIGNWIIDFENDRVSLSKNIQRIIKIDDNHLYSIRDFIDTFAYSEEDKLIISEQISNIKNSLLTNDIIFFNILGKSNQKIPIACKTTKYPDEKQNVAHGFVQDISEISDLKQQLKKSYKLATLGELAAGIGHDINNPLFVAQANFELLELNLPDEIKFANHQHISRIKKALVMTQKIVKGLRSYAEKRTQNLEPIGVHSVINEAVQMFQDIIQVETNQVKLKLNAENDQIIGNESELHQVLLNLLINASQAIEHKENALISIETLNQKSHLLIKVTDNGKGIAKTEFEKIFDSFYTTKDELKGTGLGLSIARKIIRDFKGQITVDSVKDQFTCFTIELPSLDHKEL
jgi:signal transduction histidine kinase